MTPQGAMDKYSRYDIIAAPIIAKAESYKSCFHTPQALNEEATIFEDAIRERLGNFTRNFTTCVAGLIVGRQSSCDS